MRRTPRFGFMLPKEMGLRPEHDKWRLKYEPWSHLRRMANIVGTGFYVPPEWYNHFRMFPPVQNAFLEEQTLNPYNENEQTQTLGKAKDELRSRIRKELGHQSRGLAAEGMRYYNIFWVEKAMDRAERAYHHYVSRGFTHEEAIRQALKEYYEEQAVKKRAHLIQAEEAKLSGKFLTMREASALLTALSNFQTLPLAPHQYVELTNKTKQAIAELPPKRARARKVPKKKATAAQPVDGSAPPAAAEASQPPTPATSAASAVSADEAPSSEPFAETSEPPADAPTTAGEAPAAAAAAAAPAAAEPSAFDLADILEEDSDSTTVVEAGPTIGDSVPKVQEAATGGVGRRTWYAGPTPSYPSGSKPSP